MESICQHDIRLQFVVPGILPFRFPWYIVLITHPVIVSFLENRGKVSHGPIGQRSYEDTAPIQQREMRYEQRDKTCYCCTCTWERRVSRAVNFWSIPSYLTVVRLILSYLNAYACYAVICFHAGYWQRSVGTSLLKRNVMMVRVKRLSSRTPRLLTFSRRYMVRYWLIGW